MTLAKQHFQIGVFLLFQFAYSVGFIPLASSTALSIYFFDFTPYSYAQIRNDQFEFLCIIDVQVLSATLNGSINCSCDHLTSFGGGLLVEPNPIDFDKVLVEFKNLGATGNVAVIVTVVVVLLSYIVVAVVARKADVEDSRNVRIQFNPLSPLFTRKLKSYRVMRPHQNN